MGVLDLGLFRPCLKTSFSNTQKTESYISNFGVLFLMLRILWGLFSEYWILVESLHTDGAFSDFWISYVKKLSRLICGNAPASTSQEQKRRALLMFTTCV